MKKLCLISLIALSFGALSQSGSIIMEGQYNGKNILVKNTYGEGGRSFCITEVFVNGKITRDEINNTMFPIELAKSGIKPGDQVKVEIKYKENCVYPYKPLIMNPGVLVTDKTMQSTITIDGKFYWKNILVSNPRIPQTDDFGVKQVLVNGKQVSVDLRSDIFEIDLVAIGLQEKDPLKDGDKIKIEIKYQTGYDPLILNPEY